MKSWRSAVGLLTTFPVSRGRRPPDRLPAARGWFPLVGLLLGLLLATLDLLLHWGHFELVDSGEASPRLFLSAVLVAVLVVLTRALHLDGFMDACDALMGGDDPAQRLRILKDPHAGAFAVVGVACLLLIKVTSVAALAWPGRTWVLILFPCLSRWAMALAMEGFVGREGRRHFYLGSVATGVVTVILAGPGGLALMALAGVVAWVIGAWSTRLLGGMTGDVYGMVNELAEAAILVAAAMVIGEGSTVLSFPLQLPLNWLP